MKKSRNTNSTLKFSMKTSADHPQEDVLTTIKAQHKVLKESIKVLKDEEAAVHLKQRHLAQFLPYLKMHSEAEERTIYATLEEIDDAQVATIEAITEHALAKSLVSELEKKDFSSVWDSETEAKAKVLAELVEHHAEEEEEEFFEKARQNLARIELVAIGQEFRSLCREFQAREAEQVQPRRQRGHGERPVMKSH
ncbi:MAG: hemerythrin domain-containing protein [Bdellovibrionaceae bacterium]|nr:hemerythrin domain-containing protein [Pseudobdellovibrionaceae bacterium]